MEMGYLAPSHHSLISILNENGYQTSYFGGYESRFDKLDQFLERQQVDLLMDASRFTDDYSKMDEIEGGFTWGYSDKDTYRRAFDFIDEYDLQSPRLDIFFTLNFHEPFIIQEPEEYQRKFRERLNTINPEPSKREEYEQYDNIFRALLYTDDAIRELMNRYRQRVDFDDTIFVITGDHRMIPIPHGNRIDRYYVPFMIYSPLLKESAMFEGVSSHLDVTPTILGYLEQNYSFTQPDSVHWLGDMLSKSHEFTSDRRVPLMRNKNQMPDYLSGKYYLSGNQLFELERGMRLRRIDDPDIFERVNREFSEFKRINRYVTSNDKIIRYSDEDQAKREQLLEEENYFTGRQLQGLNVVDLFSRARELAFTGQYEDARLILRRVLRERPNYHDVRLLLGRTYGWNGMYDLAESEFNEVIRRNPEVADAYSAKADLYFWQDEPEETIEIVNEGLSNVGKKAELLFRKARAYLQMGDQNEASAMVEEALNLYPENQNLLELNERL
jgi:tetratricopeptide (TPR) repeat protein